MPSRDARGGYEATGLHHDARRYSNLAYHEEPIAFFEVPAPELASRLVGYGDKCWSRNGHATPLGGQRRAGNHGSPGLLRGVPESCRLEDNTLYGGRSRARCLLRACENQTEKSETEDAHDLRGIIAKSHGEAGRRTKRKL